ncbi:hypothetical protein lbkm_1858 [Lachnospiraceae bacterium KM106-2]|nr:hypothetical protein lbkm_1858 [Lachnospiraceae bacterium KM106-2]
MALPDGKKRVAISLTEKEIEIIQTISKRDRRNVSDTVAIMIEKYLLPEYEELMKQKEQ